MEIQKQIDGIIEEMNELNKKLVGWPKLKKAGLAIIKIPEEERNKKQKKKLKIYNEILPLRERMRELKTQKDNLKLQKKLLIKNPKPMVELVKGLNPRQPTLNQQEKSQRKRFNATSFFNQSVRETHWIKKR